MSHKQIYYSDKYDDDKYEYRHVMLPKDIAKRVPKTHLMSETEWRNLGVQQSQGWVHYMIHQPEPHILLFRRPLVNQPKVIRERIAGSLEDQSCLSQINPK
ncbi:cyclin-dependent kinases regulatory subunit 1 [Sander lucioperca]|nr:cyclin-dependent kinases regulatory subunit 1 [Perca flavescens]XP_031151916.1 cyclin-dependent kinases regulatory subunit 1 [Sander lucioperca]XP_032391458.1 cyclin-dependent kinases regulatory subunit 1 [Etheostoma spectabile]XP_034748882.1 cyclin-dependent kinases regulatory subunit 1 [Etheostoma cragini]XP_039677160.1 cyclin-dependent kinases regulatory subunit 1 [Perca fluviatilis]XP_039677161.1 cyclin-dependent kinases regulatory subunit 1 [Perca fluviatilis]